MIFNLVGRLDDPQKWVVVRVKMKSVIFALPQFGNGYHFVQRLDFDFDDNQQESMMNREEESSTNYAIHDSIFTLLMMNENAETRAPGKCLR